LETDKFNLSTSIGTGAEAALNKKGKFFYLSTTRHRLGGFSLDPGNGQATLVLDGDKLGYTYSGSPVDYWGPEFRKIEPRKAEAEDRIYHTKPQINNASKYIKEIHVLVPVDMQWDWAGDYRNRSLRDLYKNALKKRIPIYFYDDKKAYLIQNKNKSIKMDVKSLAPTDKLTFDVTRQRRNYFKRWEEMFYIDKLDKLSKDAQDVVWRINGANENDFYFKDYLGSLSADIHNQKSDPKFTTMLTKMFRKAKVTSAKEFLLYLANKWGKILKDD
jgi:hypothetical protein